MKVVLHIGMGKCGTTSLQRCFSDSRDYLLSKGILYPETLTGSSQHDLLVAEFFPFESLPRRISKDGRYDEHSVRDACHEFRRNIKKRIKERNPECLLLSCEYLFRPHNETSLARFRDLMEAISTDMEVVAYVRRPSEYYVSKLQQNIKATSVIPPPKTLNVKPVLNGYRKLVGGRRIKVRPYARATLHDNDIVTDFIKTHLEDYDLERDSLTPVASENRSLSAESVDIIRDYRKVFHSDNDDRFTRDTNSLIALLAGGEEAAGCGKIRLRPEVAELIDYASRDLLWLRDQFGVFFEDIDYSRIRHRDIAGTVDYRRLSDILVIDRGKEHQLLASLLDTAFIGNHAGRNRWARDRISRLADHQD